MNKVMILGRLTKDVDIRYTDNGKVVGRFSVAVNRPKQKGQERAEADFINCVAFGKTAEVIGNYFFKGSRILVTNGTIRTGSYKNKNGDTVYTTDVWVSDFEFVDKQSNGNGSGNGNYSNNNSYSTDGSVPPDFDVPF